MERTFQTMAELDVSTEKLQERVKILEELLEINLYLNSTLDIDDLLQLIMETSKEALKVQAVSILLVDKKNGELFFRCALGGGADTIKPFRLKPGEGIAGAAAQTRKPIVVADAQDDPRFAKRFDSVSGFVTHSMLAIPMWTKEQVIGVLELMNKERDGSVENFNDDDLQKAAVLANMAAVAIENAQLYQDLNQSYELVKAAEKSKGEFISIISHELRTPLVPIKGYSYLLRKQRSRLPEETQNEFLEEIQRQSEHLNMLIEDLFLVNEVETVRFNAELAPVPLQKLIDEALQIKKVDTKTHPIKIEIDPGIGGESPQLNVDADKITHLLVHLLDNAVKFSPDGGPFTIRLALVGDELQLSLQDEGVGVPEEFRERVFDRFYQVDSTATRRYGGTGVGLFIVKKIAQAHGGRAFCEPASPKGTRIVVALPARSLVR